AFDRVRPSGSTPRTTQLDSEPPLGTAGSGAGVVPAANGEFRAGSQYVLSTHIRQARSEGEAQ
ncbi:MAG: hypothetical protein ACREC9_16995, partial [Methylocella sp.]